MYKAVPNTKPKPDTGLSDEGDQFYHRDINKDPLSSLGIDPNEPAPGVVDEIEHNKELHDGLLTLEKDREKQIEQMQLISDTAVRMGSAIGDAFDGLISGTESFASALAKLTEEIINMYLRQSIAAMIKASIEDPSTPFPFAKVAIAAAGIGIIKGLFNKIGGHGGAYGGSGGSAPGRTPDTRVDVGGKIYGYDLAIVGLKEGSRSGRLG